MIEDGSRLEEAEVIDEYMSEDNNKADYLTDDEIELNFILSQHLLVTTLYLHTINQLDIGFIKHLGMTVKYCST